MILNLGVNDVAYSAPGQGCTVTTGAVAGWLEDQFHVMRTFVELHEPDIEKFLVAGVNAAIEAIQMKADLGYAESFRDIGLDNAKEALRSGPMSRIEAEFRDYLDRGEWEKTSRVAIQAARNRHRIHHQDGSTEMSRRSNRAFIRTGLYQSSFRAWLAF